MVVAGFFLVFGAHMSIPFNTKMKILLRLKNHHIGVSSCVELRVLHKVGAHRPMTL